MLLNLVGLGTFKMVVRAHETHSRIKSGQRHKLILYLLPQSSEETQSQHLLCSVFMVTSDHTKVGQAFGFMPDEGRVTADRNGYIKSKLCSTGRGRYRTNMLPDGSMEMCPGVHCLSGRVSLLLNLLELS